MKIYFAHPIGHYGTAKEAAALDAILGMFPWESVLNPADKVYQEEYQRLGGKGMKYWEDLASTCDALIAMPFEDGEHGAGVWAEMAAMASRGSLVMEIHNGKLRVIDYQSIRPLSIAETRRRNAAAKEFAK